MVVIVVWVAFSCAELCVDAGLFVVGWVWVRLFVIWLRPAFDLLCTVCECLTWYLGFGHLCVSLVVRFLVGGW